MESASEIKTNDFLNHMRYSASGTTQPCCNEKHTGYVYACNYVEYIIQKSCEQNYSNFFCF